MRIELATPDDCHGIAAVQVLSWQHAYEGIVPADYLATMEVDSRAARWRDTLAQGKGQVLVARDEQGIQAFIAFGPSRDEDAPPDRAEIWALYASPLHWSQGVGRALWIEARARLFDRGVRSVSLWVLARNARAIMFYALAGFAPEARSSRWIALGGAELQELRCVCRIDTLADA